MPIERQSVAHLGEMNMLNNRTRGLRMGALAVGATVAMGGAPAHAGIDPFSVTAAETVSYDNNYLRNDSLRQSELVSSTSLTLGLDKSYGRQRYAATVTGTAQRNRQFKQFNNDGYSGALSVSSSIGANSYGSLGVQALKSLQSPDDQTGLRVAQTVSSRSASAFLLHGVYSRLGASASVQTSKTEYSVAKAQDKDQIGGRVGLRYNPSDRLSFDLGYRRADVELVNAAVQAKKINRTDIDLSTAWFVSGYTNLKGSVAMSRERRPGTEGFDFDGVTGSLSWDFTPGGRTSYGLSISRDTSNAGQGTQIAVVSDKSIASFSNPTQNLLTTTLAGSMRYSLTSKLNLSASAAFSQNSNVLNATGSNFAQLTDIRGFEKVQTQTKSVSAGFTFVPASMLSLGCNIQAYSRSKASRVLGYRGEALNCSASVILD